MDSKDQALIKMKEDLWANRIIKYIVLTFFAVGVIALLGGSYHVYQALSPVDKQDSTPQEITLPIGSTSHDIASILEEKGLIKDATMFQLYMKLDNINDLQAGHYQLAKNMSVKEIIHQLEVGGTPISMEVDNTITITEGMQLEQIAELIEVETNFTAKEFMDTVNNSIFIGNMVNKYPGLLQPLMEITNLRYPLEGYLYPKTYDYLENMSLEQLITEMIEQTNIEYQQLTEELSESYLTFHEALTLASIIEKEGVTQEDREMIAGVFFNRLAIGMPLQSDVTTLYALGIHKEYVTYEDVAVDSPYNLYIYTGFGPGPYNSPGKGAMEAVFAPAEHDYYYFVADLDTQEIYYTDDFEEHEVLVEEYVNSRLPADELADMEESENTEN